MIKLSLSVFAFTFTFTLTALVRIKGFVPHLTANFASYCCLVSIWIFLYLVDNAGKSLRPSGALGLIARHGKEVIQNVYPRLLSQSRDRTYNRLTIADGEPKFVVPNRRDGVVLAFDIHGLLMMAQRTNCVIEMIPQVGDFVAVLAIDQIQYLLRHLGTRYLNEGRRIDSQGSLRLISRTPDWEDFVGLAVTEVRHFGGTSIQVARRLRAMLENLIHTLPSERTEVLRIELDLLERSTRRFFPDTEDFAMADISDYQGVGGNKIQK